MEVPLEIYFIDAVVLESCVDASISLPDSASYETEYTIFAGDWSIIET